MFSAKLLLPSIRLTLLSILWHMFSAKLLLPCTRLTLLSIRRHLPKFRSFSIEIRLLPVSEAHPAKSHIAASAVRIYSVIIRIDLYVAAGNVDGDSFHTLIT